LADAFASQARGMSIGANAIGEMPIAADAVVPTTSSRPPKKRQFTAKADSVQQPEPR
jgi:hypothetical protein